MNKDISEHLEETKKKLTDLAEKIMLNDEDLKLDNRLFGELIQKVENVVLLDYLIELANERLENLDLYTCDEEIHNKYYKIVIGFINQIIEEKIL